MKDITKIKIDNLIKEGLGYVTDLENQAQIIGSLQETIICLYEEIQLLEQKLKYAEQDKFTILSLCYITKAHQKILEELKEKKDEPKKDI
ncbi:MAG: hypothetical protein IKB67_05395 [Clostridia bacterium]|nr:hypothetical protein [Clostridia bacterium]MBR2499127.1 hypothetical protein [Clostridia bacterium]